MARGTTGAPRNTPVDGPDVPPPAGTPGPTSVRTHGVGVPLVEFTEIGFAVALGVLLDTIVVRSVLVTALTLDIGRHVWWPSALANPEAGAVTDGT